MGRNVEHDHFPGDKDDKFTDPPAFMLRNTNIQEYLHGTITQQESISVRHSFDDALITLIMMSEWTGIEWSSLSNGMSYTSE